MTVSILIPSIVRPLFVPGLGLLQAVAAVGIFDGGIWRDGGSWDDTTALPTVLSGGEWADVGYWNDTEALPGVVSAGQWFDGGIWRDVDLI